MGLSEVYGGQNYVIVYNIFDMYTLSIIIIQDLRNWIWHLGMGVYLYTLVYILYKLTNDVSGLPIYLTQS